MNLKPLLVLIIFYSFALNCSAQYQNQTQTFYGVKGGLHYSKQVYQGIPSPVIGNAYRYGISEFRSGIAAFAFQEVAFDEQFSLFTSIGYRQGGFNAGWHYNQEANEMTASDQQVQNRFHYISTDFSLHYSILPGDNASLFIGCGGRLNILAGKDAPSWNVLLQQFRPVQVALFWTLGVKRLDILGQSFLVELEYSPGIMDTFRDYVLFGPNVYENSFGINIGYYLPVSQ